MLKSQADLQTLGTILGVWAHPDDEAYSMAGIMMAASQNGQTVVSLTATRGEAGVQDEARWPAAQLGVIRTKELEDSFRIMGIKNHIWFDYPDGGCKAIDAHLAVGRILQLIEKWQPTTIMTFGPDGLTGHDDHKTVSAWARLAVIQCGRKIRVFHAVQTREQYQDLLKADKKFNIFFNTDKPPVCDEDVCAIHFDLNDELYEKKLAALRAMPSQTEAMLNMFADSLRTSLGTEAFKEAPYSTIK